MAEQEQIAEREFSTASIQLNVVDRTAIRFINEHLSKEPWYPHKGSNCAAIRYALRSTVAALATAIQAGKKRQRTLRRRKKGYLVKGG